MLNWIVGSGRENMRAAGELKKVKMPEKCTVFSFCHYNKAVTLCEKSENFALEKCRWHCKNAENSLQWVMGRYLNLLRIAHGVFFCFCSGVRHKGYGAWRESLTHWHCEGRMWQFLNLVELSRTQLKRGWKLLLPQFVGIIYEKSTNEWETARNSPLFYAHFKYLF